MDVRLRYSIPAMNSRASDASVTLPFPNVKAGRRRLSSTGASVSCVLKKSQKRIMASYVADVPEGIFFDPEYRKFFENFYAISDTSGAHEQYANQFTPNATVIMASKRVQGTAGTSKTFQRFRTSLFRILIEARDH